MDFLVFSYDLPKADACAVNAVGQVGACGLNVVNIGACPAFACAADLAGIVDVCLAKACAKDT